MDAVGNVPLWSQRLAGRHRAAVGALRDGTVFGRVSASAGVGSGHFGRDGTCRVSGGGGDGASPVSTGWYSEYGFEVGANANEYSRKIHEHGIRARSRGFEGSSLLAGTPWLPFPTFHRRRLEGARGGGGFRPCRSVERGEARVGCASLGRGR